MRVRYVRKTEAGGDQGSRTLVMQCNELARPQLDESMARLGYEFDGILEDSAPVGAFPTRGSAPLREADRPTPVISAPAAASAAPSAVAALPKPADLVAALPEPADLVAAPSAVAALPKPADVDAAPMTIREISGLERSFVVLVPVMSLIVQRFVLNSDFKHDDFMHLYDAVAHPFLPFVLDPHGGHVMVFHKAAYWLLSRAFGLFAFPYFLLVWLTHGVNVVLLQTVIRKLTDRPAIAALCAGAWGMAPVHVATMSWFATYGQVLVVTAVLWVLLELANLARRDAAPTTGALARWAVLLLFAAGNFGMGVAIAVAFPLVAGLALPKGSRLKTVAALGATAIVMAVLYKLMMSHAGSDGAGRASRSFLSNLPQTILTFVILSTYGLSTSFAGWALTITDSVRVAASPFGKLSTEAVVMASLAVSAVVALGVAKGLSRAPSRRRALRWAVALWLVSASAYGATALGRTGGVFSKGVEATATRARYHYAGPIGLVLAAGFCVAQAMRTRAGPRWLEPAVAAGLVGLVISNLRMSELQVDPEMLQNRAYMKHVQQQLEELPTDYPGQAPIYVRNTSFTPVALILKLGVERTQFPDLAGFFAITHPDGTIEGRPVRFVEDDTDLVQRIRREQRPPASTLLVAETEVAKGMSVALLDMVAPKTGRGPENEMARALRESRDPKVRAELARALRESRDAKVRRELARALRESKDDGEREALADAVRKEAESPNAKEPLQPIP